MKRKSDFVTNSSSCSFIFVGWKMEQTLANVKKIADSVGVTYDFKMDTIDILNEIEKFNQTFIYFGDDEETGMESDKIYIGIYSKIDEDDPENEISFDSLTKNKNLCDTLGMENLKIITGTMVS